jgi:anti-sigma regulatory factor (Ser/Thr protein kinase)
MWCRRKDVVGAKSTTRKDFRMELRTVEMDCRADLLAPRHARAFVATAVKASGLDDLVERAELLTSEVVTNAMVHAQSPVHLVVEAQSSSVVVEVQDATGQTHAVVADEEVAEADHGRGMVLVEALSDRWGWWDVDGGRVVWFALSAA